MAAPRVSIVIPSLDGYRGGCVPRLIESIERQTFRDFETIVVKGVSPQGRAINEGVAQAQGEILVILDDDSRLAHERVIANLISAIESDRGIGMAGASIVVPCEATLFQRRAARQFPRFRTPLVDTITDSDLACHGCCAFRMDVFREIGGEREDIVRGLDPDLRMRLRQHGYRVVLVPDCAIEHPLPDGWRPLLRQFFRNGYGSAYSWKFQPDSVYETHERLDSTGFAGKTSLPYRVARFPLRLLVALAQARFIRLGAYCSYAFGYVWGLTTAREHLRAS